MAPKRNRLLSAFAVAVLCATIATLLWLRGSVAASLEATVTTTLASFNPMLLGDSTDAFANFDAAEAIVRGARSNPNIRNLIVTKRLREPGGGYHEAPIVPFDLLARQGPGWRDGLAGMLAKPLTLNGQENGRLYFDLDRSTLRAVDGSIGAAAVALATLLALLVSRLYSQETTIHRAASELDQRKRELIRLERLALAGQLSANLLHDLKKPVLNIRHNLDDLRRDMAQPAAGASLDETRSQLDLFFQMLSDSGIERFVKSDRVSEEHLDVNDLVRQAARLVHYERGSVEIVERFGERLPSVLAQPFRLVQVLSNLILNAYQAMGGKGTLTLETRAAEGGVEISVADSGPGIPAEALPSIFDPFFTTKGESEGTGLGLAISRLIVEELKGRIGVESPPGGPTVFRVWLPAS